jgi:hypothetical protein
MAHIAPQQAPYKRRLVPRWARYSGALKLLRELAQRLGARLEDASDARVALLHSVRSAWYRARRAA